MCQRILILDDDPEIVSLLAKAFALLPFETVFVTSGIAAVVAIFEAYDEGRPFAALVMDCALPRLDGFTIARIVRVAESAGISKPARIAFFTAFAESVEQSTLLQEVGAQACWRKPEDTQNLPALIQNWLGEGLMSRRVTNGSTL